MSPQSDRACFADYVEQAGSLSEVAEFCRVQPKTVSSWHDGRWPRGEPLYLLWAFLEFRGYALTELEQLPRPSHQLLLIIACGGLSFEDAQAELKYQNLQDVYRLFRHGGGLIADRAMRLEALVKRYLPTLEAYRQEVSGDDSVVTNELAQQSLDSPATQQVVVSPQPRSNQSSLARLLRLVVKRAGEVEPDELKRQLEEVPQEEIEAFALLLLELV